MPQQTAAWQRPPRRRHRRVRERWRFRPWCTTRQGRRRHAALSTFSARGQCRPPTRVGGRTCLELLHTYLRALVHRRVRRSSGPSFAARCTAISRQAFSSRGPRGRAWALPSRPGNPAMSSSNSAASLSQVLGERFVRIRTGRGALGWLFDRERLCRPVTSTLD